MIAKVIVDITSSAVDKIFDYNIPKDMTVTKGDRVLVPFGKKNIEGYVVDFASNSDYDKSKLKDIISKLDSQPLLTENNLRLCFFMQQKFFLRAIDIIKLCVPPYVLNGKQKDTTFVQLNPNVTVKPTSIKQLEILTLLKEVGEIRRDILFYKFSQSAYKTLLDKGALVLRQEKTYRKPTNSFEVSKKDIVLNAEQQKAVDTICKYKYNTFLLHGVTGSGKTEVYINVIKNALKQGKGAIMLVPEISLTPQMSARFKNAFGDTVAILHSSLKPGERFDEWNRLKNGEAKIAIGARSCIFAPIENLGVIVIDEEHDGSYYAESNPRFHTHEVARYLAYLNNCPLILGSATPSIESFYRVKTGEYTLISLPNRANQRELPNIEVVDMLGEVAKGNTNIFSYRLLAELEQCIADKKQAMIFINRRGFSSFLMCRECGYVPKCEDCDVSLVYHKEDNMLKCHYCQKRYKVPFKCPKCGSPSLRYGAVGTERIVEELKKMYNVPIFRLDNDTTKDKSAYVDILTKFNNTSPAILVGTQMIAKGHDFNNVTLVGIVDADISLHFSDYRAVERTFQLITQVAGRAGRSDKEGKVVLQTYYPKHFAYRCACNYDYNAFFKREIKLREVSHFPPFVDMIRVLVVGANEQKTQDTLQRIFEQFKVLKDAYPSDFVYLAPMKCPKKRLQGNFRFQILIRLQKKNEQSILPKIHEICRDIKAPQVSIFIENDPQNLS